MTRYATPKLAAYASVSAVGLLTALVLARPELVALTAPFLLALCAGLALATPPRLTVDVTLEDERALEGDEVRRGSCWRRARRSTGSSCTRVCRTESSWPRPQPGGVAASRRRAPELELTLRAVRWGGHLIGPTTSARATRSGCSPGRRPPRRARSCAPIRARRCCAGSSRPPRRRCSPATRSRGRKSEGIEFADIRLWTPGDTLKRVNWRASARRGDLWVNESHPERNTDVILFVDSFAEARRGDEGTLDLAVRATAALADAYVRRRDRVGLISFGGILRWLVPGTGIVQLYRIIDALLDTQIFLSYYWKEIDVIPRRTLPPSALVLALSPLLDPRSVGALLDLRARGFDLAVVDVSPVPFTARPTRGLDAVAYDVWTLRRDALRHRLQRAGVAVVEWDTTEPLQAILEEVRAFRRYARHARV